MLTILTLAPLTSASSLLNYGPATPHIARNVTFLDDPFGCKYKQSWHMDFIKSVKLVRAVPLPFSPCCVLTKEPRTLVMLIFPPWVSSSISSLKIPFIPGVFYKLGIESRGSTRNEFSVSTRVLLSWDLPSVLSRKHRSSGSFFVGCWAWLQVICHLKFYVKVPISWSRPG